MKEKTNFSIGSDPEFLYYNRDTGYLVKPQKVLNFLRISTASGQIGIDGGGGGTTAELRPPAGTPEEHLLHIKNLIANLYAIHQGTKGIISAGTVSNRHPLGGHIHFGTNAHTSPQHINFLQGEAGRRLIASNLNYWLAPLLIPMWDRDTLISRASGGYGPLSNGTYRGQAWGIEYRPLPSWLGDHRLAYGVLALAYVIVKLTLEDKITARDRKKDDLWIHATYNRIAYGDYTDAYQRFTEIRADSIAKLLEKSEETAYAKVIQEFLEELQKLPKKRNKNFDIFRGWGYTPLDYTKASQDFRQTTAQQFDVSRDDEVVKNRLTFKWGNARDNGDVPDFIEPEVVIDMLRLGEVHSNLTFLDGRAREKEFDDRLVKKAQEHILRQNPRFEKQVITAKVYVPIIKAGKLIYVLTEKKAEFLENDGREVASLPARVAAAAVELETEVALDEMGF